MCVGLVFNFFQFYLRTNATDEPTQLAQRKAITDGARSACMDKDKVKKFFIPGKKELPDGKPFIAKKPLRNISSKTADYIPHYVPSKPPLSDSVVEAMQSTTDLLHLENGVYKPKEQTTSSSGGESCDDPSSLDDSMSDKDNHPLLQELLQEEGNQGFPSLDLPTVPHSHSFPGQSSDLNSTADLVTVEVPASKVLTDQSLLDTSVAPSTKSSISWTSDHAFSRKKKLFKKRPVSHTVAQLLSEKQGTPLPKKRKYNRKLNTRAFLPYTPRVTRSRSRTAKNETDIPASLQVNVDLVAPDSEWQPVSTSSPLNPPIEPTPVNSPLNPDDSYFVRC